MSKLYDENEVCDPMTYLDNLQMVKMGLIDITKQTNGLAIGLQNAAPPQAGLPPSVQYLMETTTFLQEELKRINQLIQEISS